MTEVQSPGTPPVSVICDVRAVAVVHNPETQSAAAEPVSVEWDETGVILPVPESSEVDIEVEISTVVPLVNEQLSNASLQGAVETTDNEAVDALEVAEPSVNPSMSPLAVVESLSPRPKVGKARQRTRKVQTAAVITSSPYKAQLQLQQQCASKSRKVNKSAQAATKSTLPEQSKKKPTMTTVKRKRSMPKNGQATKSRKCEEQQDDTPCSICSKKYCAEPYVDFLQCARCCSWYCEPCGPADINMCYKCLP